MLSLSIIRGGSSVSARETATNVPFGTGSLKPSQRFLRKNRRNAAMWLSISPKPYPLDAKPQDSIGRRVDRQGDSLTPRPHYVRSFSLHESHLQ